MNLVLPRNVTRLLDKHRGKNSRQSLLVAVLMRLTADRSLTMSEAIVEASDTLERKNYARNIKTREEGTDKD